MKFLIHKTTLALAVLVSVSFTPAGAVDIVTKKSDAKKVSGSISAMSKTDVTIKRLQGDETIAANDLAAIEWDGGGPTLKLGYPEENSGQYELATKSFQKAKSEAKSPSPFLAGEYEYVLARVLARQALTDPDKREQAIQKLMAAQKAYPEHVRFYESALFLSQVQLAAKDFEGLHKTIEILKKAPWNDVKLAAQITESRALVSEGKIEDAIAGFEAVANSAGDSPVELARKYEAQLGQARGLILQTKLDEALKILEAVVEKASAEETAVLAEAYVLEGQALSRLGRNKEAALAYLHVDVLFPREANFHAEALYQLSSLWKLVQQPDRSVEAAGKLVQIYPHSEWRKKLAGSE